MENDYIDWRKDIRKILSNTSLTSKCQSLKLIINNETANVMVELLRSRA